MSHAPASGLILAIETSCDETAAAVVQRGTRVLSSVVASQIALHANYGGVVPELASREHLRHIVPVVRQAIAEAALLHPGLTFAQLDAIAVTHGPGLAGALLVGILYAKSLALALGKPLIAINHLEGHIHAVLLNRLPSAAPTPTLALVVSGGHTHLYLADPAPHPRERANSYRNIGRTVDDAAGEAFDKVAKLLGLGYPGGPWIDALASHGNPSAVPFQFHAIKPGPTADPDAPRFDFSFSGIKTAVLRYTEKHGLAPSIAARKSAIDTLLAANPSLKPADALHLFTPQDLDLIASFQSAVVGNLLRQTLAAADHHHLRHLIVTGGVSANSELRHRFTHEAAQRQLSVDFAAVNFSTDNAAMIAAAAWPRLLQEDFAPETLSASPQLKLA